MFDSSNFLAVTGFSLLAVVLLMAATAVEGHRQGRVSTPGQALAATSQIPHQTQESPK